MLRQRLLADYLQYASSALSRLTKFQLANPSACWLRDRSNEEERQNLRINIHETKLDGFGVNQILEGPHEACRYCDPDKESRYFPWEARGTKDVPMEDWLIGKESVGQE